MLLMGFWAGKYASRISCDPPGEDVRHDAKRMLEQWSAIDARIGQLILKIMMRWYLKQIDY
jgi:hypothetical protein